MRGETLMREGNGKSRQVDERKARRVEYGVRLRTGKDEGGKGVIRDKMSEKKSGVR